MSNVLFWCGAIAELSVAIGMLWGGLVWFRKIVEGLRCQLRTDMVTTYYHCKEKKQIRQYEVESFIKNYQAYKALKGNSFIDEIYERVIEYDVIN